VVLKEGCLFKALTGLNCKAFDELLPDLEIVFNPSAIVKAQKPLHLAVGGARKARVTGSRRQAIFYFNR